MKRHQFLQLLSTGGIASMTPFLSFEEQQSSHISDKHLSDLEKHTITDIYFTEVALHYPRQVGKNAQLDIHGMGPTIKVGIVHTDKRAVGWRMLQGGSEEEAAAYLNGKLILSSAPGFGMKLLKNYG